MEDEREPVSALAALCTLSTTEMSKNITPLSIPGVINSLDDAYDLDCIHLCYSFLFFLNTVQNVWKCVAKIPSELKHLRPSLSKKGEALVNVMITSSSSNRCEGLHKLLGKVDVTSFKV